MGAVTVFVVLYSSSQLSTAQQLADPSVTGRCPLTQSPVRATNETASDRLGELQHDSTIVREMLAFLRTRNVALTIGSNNALLRCRRVGGLSRFFVAEGVLAGHIEFDTGARSPRMQRVALAHELAHAVEIAALPRRSTRALGNELLSRAGHHEPWSPERRIETPFAESVSAKVAAEIKSGSARADNLESLANRHRLRLRSGPGSSCWSRKDD